MTARTAAAPRFRRRIWPATAALATFGFLGFAVSQAVAGSALPPQAGTEAAPTTTAPDPDPQPAPRPDPKPARAKTRPRAAPPPPPPPPPAASRTPARVTTQSTPPPPAPRASTERQAEAAEPPTTEPRRRTRAAAAPKAKARITKRVAARKPTPAVQKPRRRPAPADSTHEAFPLDLPPPATSTVDPSGPGLPSAVLPLFLLGLALLIGSTVSAHRVPWPTVAAPLAAHRANLAAVGCGTIALALLWLNVAVFL